MTTKRVLNAVLTIELGLAAVFLVVARAEPAQSINSLSSFVNGSRFPITADPGDQQAGVVAYDRSRDRFLVVYENAGGNQIAACVTSDGTIVESYVIGPGQNADVVYAADHDNYVVVFDQNNRIEGKFIGGECCPTCSGPTIPISGDRTGVEYGPAIAYNNHSSHQDFLVVWSEGGTINGVYARQFLATGNLPNPSFAIAHNAASWNYEPDVAYNINRNEYLVVYTRDKSKGTNVDDLDVYGRRVRNTGGVAPLAEKAIDSSGKVQQNASVAAYRLNQTTSYLVAFTDFWNDTSGDIRAYLVTPDGDPNTLINIATDSGRVEIVVDVASSEQLGGYTAVWMEKDGGKFDIIGRQINHTGFLEPKTPIATDPAIDERYPTVAGGKPSLMVVWQEFDNGNWDIIADVFGSLRLYLPLIQR